ncbi:MAG TPA: hypothetical protein ENI36_03785, partial [Thermoplasmatales archaeon]|nr:hypothetical protein [Thermoplasmatales archaeon]
MPMRPRTPEEEDAVYEPEMRYDVNPDMVYSEEEQVEIPQRNMTTDRSKEDILDDRIAILEKKHKEKQFLAEKKQVIRDKKRQIRRLQYSPVYKSAELVVGGIKKTVEKFTGNEKTPEEKLVSMQRKQMRKEKMQRFMKSMEKFGDTTSYDVVYNRGNDKKSKTNIDIGGKSLDFFGNGKRIDFTVGSKKKGLSLLSNDKNISFFGRSGDLSLGLGSKSNSLVGFGNDSNVNFR